MSLSREVALECPACHASSPFIEHASINVAGDPGLKVKLLNGALQRFHCRACGREASVEHPMLYNDAVQHQLMVQLDPSGELSAAALDLPLPSAILDGVVTRIVHRRNDLIEKILLTEAGLDDRVFEVLKVLLEAQEGLTETRIYFEGIKGRELTLNLFDEQGVSGASIPREAYDDLQTDLAARGVLGEQLAWAVVDRDFAMAWLRLPELPSLTGGVSQRASPRCQSMLNGVWRGLTPQPPLQLRGEGEEKEDCSMVFCPEVLAPLATKLESPRRPCGPPTRDESAPVGGDFHSSRGQG